MMLHCLAAEQLSMRERDTLKNLLPSDLIANRYLESYTPSLLADDRNSTCVIFLRNASIYFCYSCSIIIQSGECCGNAVFNL